MNGLALCAGIGGLELGLRLALGDSYRTVCYVEREAFAAATLVARMDDEAVDRAPIWDDLTTFVGTSWSGLVDIITAGFPCQPFSTAGSRRGIDDERWLWSHIASIIADAEPQLVFLENVPGLVGHGLRVVWTDLRRLGFRVRAGFFSAAEVGAPHRRQRLFVLGYTDRWRQQGERVQEYADEPGAPRDESHGYGEDGDEHGAGGYDLDEGRVPDTVGARVRVEPERGRGAARQTKPWNAESRDLGPDVSDAEHEQRGPGASERYRDGRHSTWPPPPGSSVWPRGLEPAICRVAHGPTDRNDRLRAIGNGVVPLVAAHAFRVLANRR